MEGVNYANYTENELSDPQKCRGFKLNDLVEETMEVRHVSSHIQTFQSGKDKFGNKPPTKMAFDIVSAPDEKAALELAFFGQHYFKQGTNKPKDFLDERYQKNDPKSLLFFNELGAGKELELLEIYTAAIKSDLCGTANHNYDATDGNKYGAGD